MLDLSLPAGDGFLVAGRLQNLVSSGATPIIFITSNENPVLRERAMAMGAAAFLTKPFDATSLADAVETAPLARRQLDAPGQRPVMATAVPAKEKFSVLIVDDDPTVIRILSRILSDFAPLRFATSGQVALKLARESVPDLVLLDVEMPEFSGFETCKAFQERSGACGHSHHFHQQPRKSATRNRRHAVGCGRFHQ